MGKSWNISPLLKELLDRTEGWIEFTDLTELIERYFASSRTRQELMDYREKKGNCKKLRDEILPVYKLLTLMRFGGSLKFARPPSPDVIIHHDDGRSWEMEVTVALSRASYENGKRLNKHGHSYGTWPVPDNAPPGSFQPDGMIAHDDLIARTVDGTSQVLAKKIQKYRSSPQYAGRSGVILLIEVPAFHLEADRWVSAFDGLKLQATNSPFQHVYLISSDNIDNNKPFSVALK